MMSILIFAKNKSYKASSKVYNNSPHELKTGQCYKHSLDK